ncbi:GNAT family N-acetyltransferase [Roseomonas marmotae]|uniref:GNAT family N-acetyltransferase n=1 Tax=Roseomonas marmotae TaxID=2768161 RepID=A0ABS3K933_9PROT|nr:GNAT family N-acetyltransferase [Roseomonas marmotae]MBO1073950.1 GNAT family N-acetyltransferase [Roseomonas marmotae]QTI78437.1 GNAT family N-acetyltransferase [Roseomonas marmotae]
MSEEVRIGPASQDDRADWLELWAQYCAFGGAVLPQNVTDTTWRRILAPQEPVHCLLARDASGKAVGFCNYVCHPNTWSTQTVCYLEDLFVHPEARRMGVGTRLIQELAAIGRRENWLRIYWHTKTDNHQARAAYDRIATRTDHLRYEITL